MGLLIGLFMPWVIESFNTVITNLKRDGVIIGKIVRDDGFNVGVGISVCKGICTVMGMLLKGEKLFS